MPGRSAEQRAGYITQLGFDSLTQISVSDGVSPEKQNGLTTAAKDAKPPPHSKATAIFGESRQFAAPRRRKAKKKESVSENVKQSSLDELFATISSGADIPRSITISENLRDYAKQGRISQLDFDSLTALPADDAETVEAREPAGNGNQQNGAADQRSDIQPSGSEHDGLSGLPEQTHRPVPTSRSARITQLDFGSLPAIPADNVDTIAAEEPAEIGTEGDSATILQSDEQPGSSEQDGLCNHPDENDKPIPPARRRVILDEP